MRKFLVQIRGFIWALFTRGLMHREALNAALLGVSIFGISRVGAIRQIQVVLG